MHCKCKCPNYVNKSSIASYNRPKHWNKNYSQCPCQYVHPHSFLLYSWSFHRFSGERKNMQIKTSSARQRGWYDVVLDFQLYLRRLSLFHIDDNDNARILDVRKGCGTSFRWRFRIISVHYGADLRLWFINSSLLIPFFKAIWVSTLQGFHYSIITSLIPLSSQQSQFCADCSHCEFRRKLSLVCRHDMPNCRFLTGRCLHYWFCCR